MRKSRWFAVVLASGLMLIMVVTVSALTYKVRWGDTLSGIAARFNTSVEAIVQQNQIEDPNLIFAGQDLEIPAAGETPTPAPPPDTPPSGESGSYTVKAGDTLTQIARRFGTTVSAISQANGLWNPNYISIGQVLVIPGGGGDTGDTTPPPAPPPAPAPSGGDGAFELGGQALGLGRKAEMNQAGMTWVKYQHKWSPGDAPGELAGAIQDAHNNGFKVLLSIPGASEHPAPGSMEFGRYVEFLGGVAALGPDAIEVWNEMNIDVEWPTGEINPATYVNQMLAPAYNAIKAANANVMVISGALAPTGFDNGSNAWADDRYLAGMRAAGAANYMDCIGVHHNAGATSPNVTTGHPAAYHYSWYFWPTLNLYYNTFGGARKVCFTELGYVSPEGFGGISAGFSWASETSVAEHAQWLAEAASLSATSGKVRLLIVFNVDFTNYDVNGDPQAGYAIVRPDGSCPACATLGAVMNP
jgi:LysM repeat protein